MRIILSSIMLMFLKKQTHGSVFDTITRNTFDDIEVDIPDFDCQKKIASLLSDLDAKIELNIKINENLDVNCNQEATN